MNSKQALGEISRRQMLVGMAAAAAAPVALAIEPMVRIKPRLGRLALTSFSLKPHMRWFEGQETGGKLEMLGFLDYCAELQLDGVELTSYFFPTPLEMGYLNLLKRRAHVLGLDISSGAMANNFGYAPGSDEARRQQAYTRKWIDHFADLGAPVVRVFASKAPPQGVSDEQVLKHVTDNLGEALAHAERRGVLLGLENHDFVKNIDRLLQVVRSIDSPWFGVIWDSANLDSVPDPYAELARIAPYALVAQVKVMTRVDGEPQPADFPRLVEILRKAGYGGYVTLEYEEPEDPYEAIPSFVKQLREVLATAAAVTPATE